MLKKSMLLLLALNTSAFGAERVKTEVSSKWEKDQVTVTFKVAISNGLKVNQDAPWRLKLLDANATVFEKVSFTKADFQKDLPGFIVLSKKIPKKEHPKSLTYELTAYSCNADASQCFHDVIKGETKL